MLKSNNTEIDFFSLASIVDIGCMKLNAIISRSLMKDYIDLYFILQDIDLKSLIKAMQKKFPQIDANLALKSLVYFEDVVQEEINYKHNNKVSFGKVKKLLQEKVKDFFK